MEAEVALVLIADDLIGVNLIAELMLGLVVHRLAADTVLMLGTCLTELLSVKLNSRRLNALGNSDADTVDESAVVILHGLQLVSQDIHVVIAELLAHALVVMIVDELRQPADTGSKLPLLLTESLVNFKRYH